MGEVRIDRKSSIESEPRTLNFDQIQYAREAALCVVKTMSREQAECIFTEGLEPVESCRRNGDAMMDFSKEMEYMENQLRLPAGITRDTASAPF